jgi:hypothetical protein
MNQIIHSYNHCPIKQAPSRRGEDFYPEWMKKHDGKIPTVHRSDREFMCDLFLHDVEIREKLKKFIADTPAKEKLFNFFF